MKLMLLFLIIFFGTLLAAGLVALGEPQGAAPISTTLHERHGFPLADAGG